MPKHGNFEADAVSVAKPRWTPAAIALLVVALLVFGGLLVAIIMANKNPLPFDEAILNSVLGMRKDSITKVVNWITQIAMPPAWIVTAIALSVFAKNWRPFVAFVLAGGIGWIINEVVKHLMLRPRPPEELRLAVETSSSFPSGHSITAVALYGFLLWMVLRYVAKGGWRTFLVVLTGLVIVLLGLTRIYLGVHWTSDVLAGAALGTVWLVVYTRLIAPRILADSAEEA